MELYPEKVQLAVYMSAVMPLQGDNFYQTLRNELQFPPFRAVDRTDVELDKSLYRPVAFGPTLDTIHLTPDRYGVVEKHFMKLLDDVVFFPEINNTTSIAAVKGRDYTYVLSTLIMQCNFHIRRS
ncbi:hypothetical protein AXG93_163s1360 [Marchantia polymorpha subsp. ruderalis]|uniref:Uncharacterized protein n=1 Tax=Marchantia polymorpha subsp. ruderalis TaxID=1480154 RepID=A0A176VD91_MARPO|nr:hypothetical protein AXG93_163s1360 [Marchantia polymorpha subsp. ruderalis]